MMGIVAALRTPVRAGSIAYIDSVFVVHYSDLTTTNIADSHDAHAHGRSLLHCPHCFETAARHTSPQLLTSIDPDVSKLKVMPTSISRSFKHWA
jgi:hypothetical protein